MSISERLSGYNNVCGIEIDFTGTAAAANVDYQQRFYDSQLVGSTRKGVYYGYKSVSFNEVSERGNGNEYFSQTISFHFPNHDSQLIERVTELRKAKYILIKDSHGKELIMGRNDHKQNRAPVSSINRDMQLTTVTFNTQSTEMIGFTAAHLNAGLPHELPIYLFD